MDRFIPYANPGAYGITTELWRADRYGNLIEQIDPSLVESGQVSMNEDMTPKRRLAIDVLDPYAFTPLHDWLVPIVALSDPEGNTVAERQGLYLVVPPETVAAPSGVTGTVHGLDGTQLLHMATRDDAVIEAGEDRGAYARRLAYEVGFLPDQVRISDTGVLQPETRRFDPGSTVYSIQSDVLSNSNHYAPWGNQNGILATAPYLPLTSASPVWTYRNTTDLDALDLEGIITESPDWQRLANSVTVRRMGTGEIPTLYATARNENPLSPSSIPALGFEIARQPPVDLHDAGGQDATREEIEAALQAHAEAVLSEAASLYRKITVQTFPSLNADVHQVIGLDIRIGGRQVYDGRWWRTGWTLTLDGGNSTFTQNLARVEEWRP